MLKVTEGLVKGVNEEVVEGVTALDEQLQLHVISPADMSLEEFAEIAVNIHPYVHAVHLRSRYASARELWHMIQWMLDKGIPARKIFVNDRADVAIASAIGGVQLPSHGLPVDRVRALSSQLRIGCSVHAVEEAIDCAKQGADYLFYGHIYASRSKPGIKPRGVDSLREVVHAVNIPVIAIGGIEPQHVQEVISNGAQGIAVISGIIHAQDPVRQAQIYLHELAQTKRMEGSIQR